jgi:hypothetical protein
MNQCKNECAVWEQLLWLESGNSGLEPQQSTSQILCLCCIWDIAKKNILILNNTICLLPKLPMQYQCKGWDTLSVLQTNKQKRTKQRHRWAHMLSREGKVWLSVPRIQQIHQFSECPAIAETCSKFFLKLFLFMYLLLRQDFTLSMQPGLTLNSQSSCLSLRSSGIIAMKHCAQAL